jgi:tetratricopeptide (TPR) repeat protein
MSVHPERGRRFPGAWLSAILALVLVLGWAPRPAHGNARLAEAKAALDELRYDDARKLLQEALEDGGSGPEELAEIYRLSAQVAAALGDDAAAQGYFAHMLAIDPKFNLPAGTSPKIGEPFAAAKSQLGGRSLRCRYDVDPAGPAVAVYADADPMGMVASVRVRWTGEQSGQGEAASDRGPPYIVPLPPGERLEVTIDVLDRWGNRLTELGADAPIVVEPGRKKGGGGGKKGGGGRPLYARWWLWGSVTVVAAGAGTYFGFDVMKAQDEIEDLNRKSVEMPPVSFSEAKAVETRGKRSALLANVSFGVAGAAAVVTVICLVTGGDEKKEDDGDTVFAPVIDRDGAGVMIFTRF